MNRRRALGSLAAGAAALAAPAIVRAAPEALRFSWWGGAGRHEAMLKAVRLFESRNPGTRIKCEYMGFNGYLERLTAQIAGRSEPDVMQVNWAWLAMFSKRGTGFTDLEPFISPAAPCPSNARAIASPMPRLDPVTMAAVPVRSKRLPTTPG